MGQHVLRGTVVYRGSSAAMACAQSTGEKTRCVWQKRFWCNNKHWTFNNYRNALGLRSEMSTIYYIKCNK